VALAPNAVAMWQGLSKTNENNGKLKMLNKGLKEVKGWVLRLTPDPWNLSPDPRHLTSDL
jgi:hypothetical protein